MVYVTYECFHNLHRNVETQVLFIIRLQKEASCVSESYCNSFKVNWKEKSWLLIPGLSNVSPYFGVFESPYYREFI